MVFLGLIFILLVAAVLALLIASRVKRYFTASGNAYANAIGMFCFTISFLLIFAAIAFAIIYYTKFSWS